MSIADGVIGSFNIAGATETQIDFDLLLPASIETIENFDLLLPVSVEAADVFDLVLPVIVSQFENSVSVGNKWKTRIFIDSVDISENLFGQVTVEAEENNSRLGEFSVLSPAVNDLKDFIGKSVTIDYLEFVNGLEVLNERIFTGIIDVVQYDATDSVLSFSCVDDLPIVVDKMTKTQIENLVNGFPSDDVFDEDTVGFEYLTELKETVPVSIEKDRNGNIVRSEWAIQAINETLGEDVIEDLSIDNQIARFIDLTNQVNLKFDSRFTRLVNRELKYSWSGTNPCKTFLVEKFLTNDAVDSALNGVGDAIKDLTLVPLPDNGAYDCNGNGVPTNIFFATEEVRKVINNGFTGTSQTKFSKTITEAFDITLIAPQSIESFGLQPLNDSTSVDVEFDDSDFNSGDLPVATFPQTLANGDSFSDQEDADRFSKAFLSILNQLRTDILLEHRDNIFIVTTAIRPSLELSQYNRINTDNVRASGKVFKFVHVLDIGTGAAKTSTEIKVSATYSSLVVADSDFSVAPPRPNTTPQGTGGTRPSFEVQTVIAATGDITLPDIVDQNVFALNRKISLGGQEFETEGLQLISPEVNDDDQGDQSFNAQSEYIMSIPNDELDLGEI
ncbi:MAG: hypothetical protein HOG49_21590 [Candidatus Scalindua sp.]|jgi:hypothetical protein|nr:hypothetical protein [Candidatus Scalindua sp.]